jgi:hypothetical protein
LDKFVLEITKKMIEAGINMMMKTALQLIKRESPTLTGSYPDDQRCGGRCWRGRGRRACEYLIWIWVLARDQVLFLG